MSRLRQAGQLRVPMDLERRFPITDNVGGQLPLWLSVGRVWANIRPVSAREIVIANHRTGEITHHIQIRYNPNQPVISGMRLINATRRFDILVVHDPDETKAMQVCLAREVGR